MSVAVPTAEEFAALERRVATLEQGASTPPDPQPIPPDPPSGSGVQAKRIASLIEHFGVNTFSSMDTNNVWGSWPADYRPDTVVAALKYITGATRFCLGIREYHYAGRESFQVPWLEQIRASYPDSVVTLCVGANGSTNDVPSMVSMAAAYYEGLNEPNTNFGSGEVPYLVTQGIQDDLAGRKPLDVVMGPSIVAGMPHPEGWITGYCGAGIDNLNAKMQIGNGHYYPPHCPDLTGDGTSLSEYVGGLWIAYNQHPIALTEFHPTLYNSEGNKPDQPGWNGDRDAYYTLLALLRSAKCGVIGLWWYALFDYGEVYQCGLFPKNAENPRPVATALRNLCHICADPNSSLRTFAPGSLEVDIIGLPPFADWDLYQSSDGAFFLPLWKSSANAGGLADNVTISLSSTARITEFDVMTGLELQMSETSTFVSKLDASIRILKIEPTSRSQRRRRR